jgi:hypothetical protein
MHVQGGMTRINGEIGDFVLDRTLDLRWKLGKGPAK